MPHPGAPPSGTSHPMLLGETFTSSHPTQSYCALRYDFKPISAGRFRPGQIQLQPDQSKVKGTAASNRSDSIVYLF